MFSKDIILSNEKLIELVKVGFESEELDYKLYIDLDSPKCMFEICLDIMAMANTRGGYIIVGVANDYSPVGLPTEFHIDQARIQQIIDTYLQPTPEITYVERALEINGAQKKFSFLYVTSSNEIVLANKDGSYTEKPSNKQVNAFRAADIFVRKGSSTQRADADDIRLLISKLRDNHVVNSKKKNFSEEEIVELQLQQKHNLPRPDYKQFIGREDCVYDILTKLGQRFFVISIDGIGGVGKTALAQEIGRRCWDQDLFDAVIWVSAKRKKLALTGIDDVTSNLTSYETLMNTTLEVLGFGSFISKSLSEKEKQVQLLLKTSKCLIIVDNLETIEDERIFEFLKNLPDPSKALITSRKRLGEVERVVPLNQMSLDEAKKLILMDATGKQVLSLMTADDKTFRQIWGVTGGIPLAIRWVVGWISLGYDKDWVCEKVRRADSPVLDFCFKEIYEKLLTPNSRKILSLMPIFDHNPPKDELQAASDLSVGTFEEAISQLLTLSLISEKSRINDQGLNEIKYEILPLTLSFAQHKLTENRGFEVDARRRLGKYLERQEKQKEALEQYGYALDRVGATTDRGKLAALQAQLAFAAYQRGNYTEAVKLFKQGIEADPKLAYTYHLWAMVERQEGNIGKAEELFHEASVLNPNNPVIWRSWAMMKKELNDFDGSEKLLQKGLHYKKNDNPTTHSLAVLQSMKGNFEEADKLFASIYVHSPKTFTEKKDNLYVFSSRAENYRKWGEREEKNSIEKAELKYKAAWQLISRGLEYNPTDWNLIKNRIRLYGNLGNIAYKKKNHQTAEALYKRAIFYNARDENQKKHNSDIYYLRAENFHQMKKIDQALEMCNASIESWKNEDAIDLRNRLLVAVN